MGIKCGKNPQLYKKINNDGVGATSANYAILKITKTILTLYANVSDNETEFI